MLVLMDYNYNVINASSVDDNNSASDDVDMIAMMSVITTMMTMMIMTMMTIMIMMTIMVMMTMTPAWRLAGQNNPAAAQHFHHWLQHLSAALKDFHE